MTNDIDNIATTLQQSLTQLITSVVTIVGVIVMMLTISPLLTLIVVVTLPLYVLVTRLVAKRSQRYFAAQQKELGALNGHVEEMYTGHAIVKAFGHEAASIERFNAINERLYHAGWKAQFVSGIIMPLMNFVSNLGYVLVSVVGGILVSQGSITIGDLQAFIQYSQPVHHADRADRQHRQRHPVHHRLGRARLRAAGRGGGDPGRAGGAGARARRAATCASRRSTSATRSRRR